MKNKLSQILVTTSVVASLGLLPATALASIPDAGSSAGSPSSSTSSSDPSGTVDCSNQSNLTTLQAIQCGTNGASGSKQTSADATKKLNGTITALVNVLTAIVGVLSVIMIIIGGLRYVTSGGKEESIKSAKNTITYAIIGLVIVALAQTIARFVLNKTTSG